MSVIRPLIEGSDLVVGEIFEGSAPGPYDDSWLVEQQNPLPGQQVAPGTAVDLLVKSPSDDCMPQE